MNKVSRFKAIFFDAGGTLFQPHPSVGEIYAEVAGRHGCRVQGDAVEELFREEWIRRESHRHPSRALQEREWWYDLVKDIFARLGAVRDFEAFFNELHDSFARPEVWRIFPEVEEVLHELKEAGLVLGIVSNWDARLIPLCEGLGLGRFFDFVLASGLVGFSKPEVGIFEEALRRSKTRVHEALHVGDSLKDDVEGPARLGLPAVWVDRTGRRPYPVPTIQTLSELIPLVFEFGSAQNELKR